MLPYPPDMMKDMIRTCLRYERKCLSCGYKETWKAVFPADFVEQFYPNVYINCNELCDEFNNQFNQEEKKDPNLSHRFWVCPDCGEVVYAYNRSNLLDSYTIFKIADKKSKEGIPF
tara:strand:+ start:4564 stop:4911 length:348 start_codon:yes stop_codon:yes gene_type:complete